MSMPRMRPLAMLPLVLPCGCAPETGPTIGMATTTSSPTVIPAPPTATPIPMPTPTPEPVPTREPTPMIPVDPSGLSPTGPWLVYGDYYGLRIVNQDGTGLTSLMPSSYELSSADPASIVDSTNLLAKIYYSTYLIRPERAEAIWIYQTPLNWDDRVHEYRSVGLQGDGKGGYLTSILEQGADGHLELLLHELPSGKIVDRIPALACTGCSIGEVMWSHGGRYFAFIASLDEPAPNLYVYDTRRNRLRRLTTGKETVENISWSPRGKYLAFTTKEDGPSSHLFIYATAEDATRRLSGWLDPALQIWWSPSEEWIIAEVAVRQDPPFGDPSPSLWSVRVVDGEAQWLHSFGPTFASYGGRWIDSHRFVFYYLVPYEAVYPNRQVVADVATGEVEELYCCAYGAGALDPQSLSVAVVVDDYVLGQWGYSPEELAWYEGPGVYLASPSARSPKLMLGWQPIEYRQALSWEEDLKVFATGAACDMEEANRGVWAIDLVGGLHCIANPARRWMSPDGNWRVQGQGATWLQTAEGVSVGKVSEEQPVQVVWRPDSRGFFLVAGAEINLGKGELSYVSVPDLSVRLVAGEIGKNLTGYQWLSRGVP